MIDAGCNICKSVSIYEPQIRFDPRFSGSFEAYLLPSPFHGMAWQAKLSKMARSSPLDFRAAGNKEKPAPSSVHVGIPFPERPVDLRSDFVELPKIRVWLGRGSWGRGWRWKGGACERTNVFIGFLVKHIKKRMI